MEVVLQQILFDMQFWCISDGLHACVFVVRALLAQGLGVCACIERLGLASCCHSDLTQEIVWSAPLNGSHVPPALGQGLPDMLQPQVAGGLLDR